MVSKVVLVLSALLVVAPLVFGIPYTDADLDDTAVADGADVDPMDSQYLDGLMEPRDLMDSAQKRSCIRRGGSCDHRRNDCCFSSSCRCNLWGSNCRCHRAGLFQKWG